MFVLPRYYLIYLILFCNSAGSIWSQDQLQGLNLSQMKLNGNFAYLGFVDQQTIDLVYFQDMLRMPGSPRTYGITAAVPINESNSVLGGSILSDRFGLLKRQELNMAYCYRFSIDRYFDDILSLSLAPTIGVVGVNDDIEAHDDEGLGITTRFYYNASAGVVYQHRFNKGKKMSEVNRHKFSIGLGLRSLIPITVRLSDGADGLSGYRLHLYPSGIYFISISDAIAIQAEYFSSLLKWKAQSHTLAGKVIFSEIGLELFTGFITTGKFITGVGYRLVNITNSRSDYRNLIINSGINYGLRKDLSDYRFGFYMSISMEF